MDWATIFVICFGVGAGFVILTAIFGEILGVIDAGLSTGAAPFKPILLALFLTVFGGLGLILNVFLVDWFAAGIAALAGIFIAYALYRHVIARLLKWQNTSTHEKQSLIGHPAKISEAIPQGGFGKITYSINDKIVSAPAKSETGEEIGRGTAVEIVYIEKSIYHVRKKI